MVKFNFKTLYHAATIRGQLDFEGGVYRGHAHIYTVSIINLFICTYNAHAHMHIVVDPVPCGEILRAAFIGMSWLKYAATFRGWQNFEVWRDFEEIRYMWPSMRKPCIMRWISPMVITINFHFLAWIKEESFLYTKICFIASRTPWFGAVAVVAATHKSVSATFLRFYLLTSFKNVSLLILKRWLLLLF